MAKTKYISTPEKMWELFQGYKKETKENPIKVKDWVGKDAYQVERERERPLTMVGFECYVMDHTPLSYPDLSSYFSNRDDAYSEYYAIVSRITSEIKNDQISGGMAMIYSQNLTARLNGLIDKKETEIKGGLNIPNLPDIADRK